ncbi:transcriptional regulator GntR family domain [Vibrio ponticus]|nr:transcriptional regulator GntR family domain [Vibrio ponticus]
MPPGSEELRRAIAQRYIQQGFNISHNDIVITSGALEALNLSMQVVTKPGDTVVIEMPTFYGALQCVERLGVKAIPLKLHNNQSSALAQLEQTFTQHNVTACWLMSNFHNPTGQSMSDVNKQKMVELARKHQVHLIEDDVYGELYFAQDKPSSLKSFDSAEQEQVLHCSSLSKSLCPGYRLGWVVSKRFHQPIQKLQMMSTLSGSALSSLVSLTIYNTAALIITGGSCARRCTSVPNVWLRCCVDICQVV